MEILFGFVECNPLPLSTSIGTKPRQSLKIHIMLDTLKAAKLQALQDLVFTFGENATNTKQFEELSVDDQMLVEQMIDEA